jgi:hypothetical protein
VPTWAAAGIAVGTFLNIAGFVVSSTLVVIISSAVLLVSFGWMGRLVLARSDQEWERPAVPRGSRSAAAVQKGQA